MIQVGLPSPDALEKIFRVYLDGALAGDPIHELALLAVGSTGADVQRVVKDAKRTARQQKRPLMLGDLRKAIGWTEELSGEALRRTAVHEAGHIILSVHHNGPGDVFAVIGGGASGTAGMVASYGSNYVSGNAQECRRGLQILLAGRAAEEIEFDDGGGNGVGGVDRSDLASATRVAAAMIGSYGLSGPHPLVYVANHLATDRLIEHRYMRMAVQAELANALREAKRLLLLHRAALEEVSGKLLLDRSISGDEVNRIMKRHAESDRQRSDRGEGELEPGWSP